PRHRLSPPHSASFFTATAPTPLSPLSLHDALPILLHVGIVPQHFRWTSFLPHLRMVVLDDMHVYRGVFGSHVASTTIRRCGRNRSEEHTSELQSLTNLVCRLLLEKKKHELYLVTTN